MKAFEYAEPRTEVEAIEFLSEEAKQTEVLAGGTDLVGLMKKMLVTPDRVVNIMEVPSLQRIEPQEDGAVVIGAAVTLDEVLAHPYLENYPAITDAILGINSMQLQSQGTLVGDLCQRPRCWFFRNGQQLLDQSGHVAEGDNRFHAILGNSGPAKFVSSSRIGPALIVLDAKLRLVGPTADDEQWIAAADFFVAPRHEEQQETVLLPGQLVTHVLLPAASSSYNATYEVRHGEGPDDPLAAADGSVWWTGQWNSVLGRLDPLTDVMKEYPLPPDSGPHGLVEDADGNVWFTGISQNYIGKLDPTTGEVTQYPVSEGSRGPHTPIFDQNGTLWFTMQSGMVGRLVPETGEMTIVASPISQSVRSYPYGIVVNSQGVPWYVDFRANRLGRVDPVTMEIMEYPLPNPDTRPRRIAVTPDDVLWYTDHARGYLGRFDPVTGEVQEWPSPGGTESRPYGITAVGNVIWYSESSVRPNTLVRFDTENESFQTWIIPSGGGIIRHMMATSDGNLVLACSGVNRVALVNVEN